MTLLVYAALGAVFFFLTLQLQTVLGYGPLLAGMASLPVTSSCCSSPRAAVSSRRASARGCR